MDRFDNIVDGALARLAGAAVLALLAVVVGIVIARNVFGLAMPWMDELARYLQTWLIYLGAVALVMKDDHITMDAVYTRLPPTTRRWLRSLTNILYMGGCGFAAYLSYQQATTVWRSGETSASGLLPAIIGYAALPVGFGLILLVSIYNLARPSRLDIERSSTPL